MIAICFWSGWDVARFRSFKSCNELGPVIAGYGDDAVQRGRDDGVSWADELHLELSKHSSAHSIVMRTMYNV